tara:strand:+ start:13 stop:354 length:342 start_codon:yes stop_codon:yes gene_type:complete
MRHGILNDSYDTQFLSLIYAEPLSTLIDELQSETQNYVMKNTKIYRTISQATMIAFSAKVSSQLDGLLNQKTAEECRVAYDIMKECFPNIHELQSIYEHLKQYFKGSRNPMPL